LKSHFEEEAEEIDLDSTLMFKISLLLFIKKLLRGYEK
jgi:hypothetical protein